MSEKCTHNCATCKAECHEDTDPRKFLVPVNANSTVKHVIGVVSGKGGVGKSLVTSLLAATMQKRGFKCAVLDADLTGPSIPYSFNIHESCEQSVLGIEPAVSEGGVEIISLNLLTEDETAPVIWRGPVIAGVVKQFWTDVHWGDVDYMFVDMPPGTGDVPLTVFQALPVDGVVVVATPQQMVGMIVEKAVRMADMMHKNLVGLVENMSYFKCPDCGGEHSIFGESHAAEIAEQYGIPNVARIPIDPAVSATVDSGKIEELDVDWLDGLLDAIAAL